MRKSAREWLENAVTIESGYVTAVKDAAAKYKIGVCATFLSKTEDKFQNTAIVIDRSGKILLNYAKVHTCDFRWKSCCSTAANFGCAILRESK